MRKPLFWIDQVAPINLELGLGQCKRIAYSPKVNLLAVAHENGTIVLWKLHLSGEGKTWTPVQKVTTGSTTKAIYWGGSEPFLALLKPTGLQILSDSILQTKAIGQTVQISQISSNSISIEARGKAPVKLDVLRKIKAISVSHHLLALWLGTTLEVYKMDG